MIRIDAGDFFLIEPCEEYSEQIREYRQEFLDAESSMDGCGRLRRFEDPVDYIEDCRKFAFSETVPEGWVVSTQFFFVRKSDNRLVGVIQVRHSFNDYLSKFGGHIGYSIRPSERRNGYAKSMLKAVLPYCREIGLDRVLITCIEGNLGSERTILANGGVYESAVWEEGANQKLKRFWVEL